MFQPSERVMRLVTISATIPPGESFGDLVTALHKAGFHDMTQKVTKAGNFRLQAKFQPGRAPAPSHIKPGPSR
jgi:hypothetical protein